MSRYTDMLHMNFVSDHVNPRAMVLSLGGLCIFVIDSTEEIKLI